MFHSFHVFSFLPFHPSRCIHKVESPCSDLLTSRIEAGRLVKQASFWVSIENRAWHVQVTPP